MELILLVDLYKDNTFEIYRNLTDYDSVQDSVLVLDYKYAPWPREEGNLLW